MAFSKGLSRRLSLGRHSFTKSLAIISIFLMPCGWLLCSRAHAAEAQFYDKHGKKGCRFVLETAVTAGEQARGLMFRDSLDPGSGMLFIFDGDERRHFWMLNTRIWLDMIFIHSSLTVVDVHHQAKPMDRTTISSKAPARYVLEVNGGHAGRCSIKKGSKVKFIGLPTR